MKKYQGFLIGATALCIMAGMIGLLANCVGILFAAIIQDMGFKAGDIALYYTIKSIVSALTLKFTIKWAVSKYSNYAMAVFGLLASLSYMAMYFFTAIWQWYISAAVCGFAVGCVFTAVPIILNNWFTRNNGKIIGLVMSGSGIAGVIFSPITSSLIGHYGWRITAVITGCITILLVSVPSLLFLRAKPEEAALSSDMERKTSAAAPAESAEKKHTVSAAPAWVLPLCLLTILFPAIEITFANQLTVFSMSIGYSLAIGGTMTSLAMFGNVSGKFLLGAMADRIGIFRSMWCMMGLGIVSMMLFLFAASGPVIAYAAALTFGFLYSLYSTGPALFMLQIYGREHYASKFSSIQAINTFICAIFSSLVAYIYDLTGSFAAVFWLFAAMNVATILFVKLLSAYVKKKAAS